MTDVIDILLIEDNPADALLVRKIFEDAQRQCKIRVAEDGEIAMSMLNDSTIPKPDMVLLDINMPKKDGKQVLKEIKDDEKLKYIPVIVLTSSNSPNDIMDCYGLCTNSYVVKPSSIEDHKKLLNAFDAFWFNLAALPNINTP